MARYRILSLPGGGSRGIFQAEFLARLEVDLGKPLSQRFDLVAATSTGAVVGLPIAAGIAASTVAACFRQLVSEVFVKPGILAGLRRRAMYSPAALRNGLESLLGSTSMHELSVDVLIPVSVADRYETRLLSRAAAVSVVEAAMASSAAPTYFPPHQFVGSDTRAYLDGGLWANDPTHLAVMHAIHKLGLHPDNIDVLVLGNGTHVAGRSSAELERMRRISVDAFRMLSEGTMKLQRSHARKMVEMTGVRAIIIDPELLAPVRLDDAEGALKVLSPLVDIEYERFRAQIMDEIILEHPDRFIAKDDLPAATEIGVRDANLTTFLPNRSYYKIARGDEDSISTYISKAQHDLTMVSINLMTGHGFEQLLETFYDLIVNRASSVDVRLSLLDPQNEYLMGALAPVLDMSPTALANSIGELVQKSLEFQEHIPRYRKTYFSLRAHNAIPPASAIMIDTGSENGTIQLETKTYRTSPYHSFGFEVARPSAFFETLNDSYERLIEDGRNLLREDEF